MLAQEFGAYSRAMNPGVSSESCGLSASSDDLKRDWWMFAFNYVKQFDLTHGHNQLAKAENDAIKRCVVSWEFST